VLRGGRTEHGTPSLLVWFSSDLTRRAQKSHRAATVFHTICASQTCRHHCPSPPPPLRAARAAEGGHCYSGRGRTTARGMRGRAWTGSRDMTRAQAKHSAHIAKHQVTTRRYVIRPHRLRAYVTSPRGGHTCARAQLIALQLQTALLQHLTLKAHFDS